MNNNGIQFKSFIHQLLENSNEIVKVNLTKEQKEMQIAQEAISRIDQSKNRLEKRKIMQQYNLVPEKPWGLL